MYFWIYLFNNIGLWLKKFYGKIAWHKFILQTSIKQFLLRLNEYATDCSLYTIENDFSILMQLRYIEYDRITYRYSRCSRELSSNKWTEKQQISQIIPRAIAGPSKFKWIVTINVIMLLLFAQISKTFPFRTAKWQSFLHLEVNS